MGTLEKQKHGGALYRPAKGETANPNGRPPKTVTNVLLGLKGAGYERVNQFMVMEAYELLLGLDESQLHDVIDDKKQPMLLRIVGKAMMSKNGHDMLEKMLDRAHGKAKQTNELTGPKGTSLFDKVTVEFKNGEPQYTGNKRPKADAGGGEQEEDNSTSGGESLE